MNHYILIKYLTQRLQWQHQNWKLGLLTPNPACHSVSLNISLPSSVLIVWDGLHPPKPSSWLVISPQDLWAACSMWWEDSGYTTSPRLLTLFHSVSFSLKSSPSSPLPQSFLGSCHGSWMCHHCCIRISSLGPGPHCADQPGAVFMSAWPGAYLSLR